MVYELTLKTNAQRSKNIPVNMAAQLTLADIDPINPTNLSVDCWITYKICWTLFSPGDQFLILRCQIHASSVTHCWDMSFVLELFVSICWTLLNEKRRYSFFFLKKELRNGANSFCKELAKHRNNPILV